ncbi:MAG: DNA-binding response regulator [Synechococcaceae bacterium WB9_2_112]|jgi:DNA-binding response OmpR family regulator|nr:DNA-binding response regulator [Synechococcaceae bacterium WB9_2_112]
MKLLVVEDDPTLQQALLRLLGQWGYAVEAASTAAAALAWLEQELFDLVLLDLGLPDTDGLALCQTLRRRRLHQPLVLMLTARDSSASKVAGLESGADDYVVKPFEPPVLRAQLQALLRRAHRPLMAALSGGPLQLHPGDTTVLVDGRPLQLTRKEALLLEQLLRARGGCCSKDALLLGCGDGRRAVGDDALRAHMRNLRQKLSAAGCAANLIETVYGLGYRLNPTAAA